MTNHNADVRYNDKNGKLTNSATQELTGNPAYNEIIRERNNYSNEMDTKKDVDTSTNNNNKNNNNNNNNNARNNDKHEKRAGDSATQQRFTSNPANNEKTQDTSNCIDHNLWNNPTDAVIMFERICASPNVTQINHHSCTTKLCPQCELWKEGHRWVQYWPP